MLGIRYYKADSSTFVIKTVNGKVREKGRGLSFLYNEISASIAAIPVNAQEAPFIFTMQTSDYQTLSVQGQITFQVDDPEKIAQVLNFNLKKGGLGHASEDPLRLSDRVIRIVQSIIQQEIQETTLRASLGLSRSLVALIDKRLGRGNNAKTLEQPQRENPNPLDALGIVLLDASITAVQPTPETARALEAEARELILKEADDAIYSRRKSAVEQERTIREAELQTDLFVQQKEQEIEESSIENERSTLRGKAETEAERLLASIAAEQQRKELVLLNVENEKQRADGEAYKISARMKAFKELPVENLKAMALANMEPEQLMAMAFESLAQNAGKIGELNISPDMFGQMLRKADRI